MAAVAAATNAAFAFPMVVPVVVVLRLGVVAWVLMLEG